MTKLQKMTMKGRLWTKQHSPEILLVMGLLGFGGAIYTACRATRKLDNVIEDHKDALDDVACRKENETGDDITALPEETEKRYQKEAAQVYVHTGVELAKLYWPTITLTTLSTGCILTSYNIMRKRNIALMAAYQAVSTAFAEYRKRVIEDQGADKDREYRYGVKQEKIVETYTDAKGKEKVKETTINHVEGGSMYARIFDKYNSSMWTDSPAQNRNIIANQLGSFNFILQSRGHITLNEVYGRLGFPETNEGLVVGWVYDPDDTTKDNQIDFGFGMTEEFWDDPKAWGFGKDGNGILLDFNVDGPIYGAVQGKGQTQL